MKTSLSLFVEEGIFVSKKDPGKGRKEQTFGPDRMNITSLFPRRKTIYLKILVLIPFSWMMITLLISLNNGTGSNSSTPLRVQHGMNSNNHHQAAQPQVDNSEVEGDMEGEEGRERAQNVMKEEISQKIHGYQSNNNSIKNSSKRKKSYRKEDSNHRKEDSNHNEVDSSNEYQSEVKDQESVAVLPPPRSQFHTGPGEMGKAVHLPKNLSTSVQKLVDQGWTDNAFNQYVSDMISISRSLPDVRDPK